MRIIADATGLTVSTPEGDIIMLSAQDAAFPAVRSYIAAGGRDITEIREVISTTQTTIAEVAEVAEKIVDGGSDGSYRTANGDDVAGAVTDTAIRAARENDPSAVRAFLKRLKKNPSEASRSQLFAWVKSEGLTLTRSGLIVGYKGVTEDYRSVSSGVEPVTVTLKDGTSSVQTGQITYPIGSTATIPRELVDDNRDAHCSVGLHVGTFGYAKSFGSRTLLVLVDPADVVSVPRDANGQKMRVSRFVVSSEHTGDKIAKSVAKVADPSRGRRAPKSDAGSSHRGKRHSSRRSDKHRTRPSRERRAPKVEPVVAEVAEAILAKVTVAPLSNRDLGKRFSKARRVHVPAALAHLVDTAKIIAGADGKYLPA